MSVRTLPLVFINLGGEMLYVLDRRLRMNDIVGTMFSKTFMDELLKPQQLFSHRAVKTVLTRLAHTSIMRLNPVSMDRLYELMVMAFKYQVLLCPRPKDLLLVSYNHLDSVRDLVWDTPVLLNQVDETHRKVIEVYSTFSEGELQLLRQTLLIFVQDMHIRVSLFLKNQIQNPNGRFVLPTSGPVPHGVQVPGLIDSKSRETSRTEFQVGGGFSAALREGSFELSGDRVLRLGFNTPNLLAKEELNQLARLMGSMETQNRPRGEAGFRINLFPAGQEKEEQDQQATSELARIAEQFGDEEAAPENHSGSKGDDLLAMMDDL
uniref:Organic solute carrier partner 1a n=1 Tax=Kryptolebias marmoratus TaxID=37003 RepID=A0A3Q3FV53_KRYMA